MLFDYETVRLIALGLMIALIIGYLITDGLDFGAGSLLPFIAKTDIERRIVINTIAPTWEGNQTWLVTLGGALFAFWPQVYATTFSGFYFGVLLVLFALFFRPPAFDFRSKKPEHYWRNGWDWGLFIGNFVPPLVFGVVIGNMLIGVPFYFDDTLRSFYEGGLFYSVINGEVTWGLLNPIGILFGVTAVTLMLMHGGIFIQLKTEQELNDRSKQVVKFSAITYMVLFTLAGIVVFNINGYSIISDISHSGESNPTYAKDIIVSSGAWLNNYNNNQILWLVPLSTYIFIFFTMYSSKVNKAFLGFIGSSLAITSSILTFAIAFFPFILPSSIKIEHSMTIWDATAGLLNMNWITYVAILFVPIVLTYTIYSYYKNRGVITKEYIKNNTKDAY